MRKSAFLAGAAILFLAVPAAGLSQGQGKGQGGGQAGENRGGGKEQGRGKAENRGNQGKANGQQRRAEAAAERGRGNERAGDARADRVPRRIEERGPDRADRIREVVRREAVIDRRADERRRTVDRGDRDRLRVRIVENDRYRWNPALATGCPPGLAKKNNGCLPPGQARKLAAAGAPLHYWSRYTPWYGDARRDDWRFDDGYAYRLDPSSGLVSGFLPLLGGALWPEQAWPGAYTDYAVDPYYSRYYGIGDRYDYRYANGALFAVDPETQVIQSIAGLLTGDPWAVGSPMPMGYDIYNVPPPYRDRYYDRSDALYRYSDGYVYQVDPTTRLVTEIISLLV